MPRNLDRRVECVAPVTDPALTARLAEILAVNLADDVLAWELGPDGLDEGPDQDRHRHARAPPRSSPRAGAARA